MSGCPKCGTELYSQLFHPNGARIYCPKCDYVEKLGCIFELHQRDENND